MKNKAHMIVSNGRLFTPMPWRISVCAMDALHHPRIFVEMIISQAEPLKDTDPFLLTKQLCPQVSSTHPVFIAYNGTKETLVSSAEEPLIYLSPSTVIDRIVDESASYVIVSLGQRDPEENQRARLTCVERNHRLVREYWDETLSDEECERLFKTFGYVNDKGQPSIIPRLTFKNAMIKEFSSILSAKLPFSGDISHSLFTIQFRRYFPQ